MSSAQKRGIAIFLIILIFTLPFSTALTISDTRITDVTDKSAVIRWKTDMPSVGKVAYDAQKDGAASGTTELMQEKATKSTPKTEHHLALTQLAPSTGYKVKLIAEDPATGETAEDTNGGQLYSFATEATDTTPPRIDVALPEITQVTQLDSISGETEAGAIVRLFINSELVRFDNAEDGYFTFTDLSLVPNKENMIRIEAEDAAGNTNTFEQAIFVDIKAPVLDIKPLPKVTAKAEHALSVVISEQALVTVTQNNQAIFSNTGGTEKQNIPITLAEGENAFTVTATDIAGLADEKTFSSFLDTTPPQLKATFTRGQLFYQGSAETDITGETEPHAKVFLYIFQPQPFEQKPDFSEALYEATADENGNFVFSEIDIEHRPFNLEKLAPKEVPQGLQQEALFPVELKDAQQQSYHIYIIAEDQVGHTAFFKTVVQVNSCFSSNFDFNVIPLPQFQLPHRLDPGSLDQGTQLISGVFNLSYQGTGIPKIDPATGKTLLPAFEIQNINFERACVPGYEKDISHNISCKILPTKPQLSSRVGTSAWYLRYTLQKTDEFSKQDDDFWNDLQKRQLLFPLKLIISYKERDTTGSLGITKTQAVCSELGYFVDVPIESKDLVPDFLADEGVDAIDETIEKIDAVLPTLNTAIKIAGISCMASFLGRTGTGFFRRVASKIEAFTNPDECGFKDGKQFMLPLDEDEKKALQSNEKTLSESCPATAFWWKLESKIYYAYRFACDRTFCKAAPARWTENKEYGEIKNVQLAEAQCAGTVARGEVLQKVENCGEEYKAKIISTKFPVAVSSDVLPICYIRKKTGAIYYVDPALNPKEQVVETGLYKLTPIGSFIALGQTPPDTLTARKDPLGTDNYITHPDVSCKIECKSTPGYKALNACAPEDKEGKIKLGENQFTAGYTSDCFFDNAQQKFQQCICEKEKPAEAKPTAQTAAKEEPWSYRLAQLYKEENGKYGRYYPEWRYYNGRDFTASFGLNNLFDWPTVGPAGAEGTGSVTDINPFTQHTSAVQTMCIGGIRNRLVTLRSILDGMRNCIQEADANGLQDAGLCKEIFSQYACGLFYKGLAYAANQCSPTPYDDLAKTEDYEEKGIGNYVKAGIGSVYESLDQSAKEIRGDYGNAALNDYFGGGGESFTRSICLAAFGYDWIFDTDFIQDAAYQTPFKTSVLVFPRERELVTYNPTQNTAVHNYRFAVNVFPGCKIMSHTVSLKCIDRTELSRPGVECAGQQCDCLDATKAQPSREQIVFLGSRIDPASGFQSLPIKTPYTVDGGYRYDHAVVRLQLDPNEVPEKCFDEGYRDGLFYFPLKDVTPTPTALCQVDAESGRFICGGVSSIFEPLGKAYLEPPFVQCINPTTQQPQDCASPNLYQVGQEINIQPTIVNDGNAQCLYTALITGNQVKEQTYEIPKHVIGPWSPKLPLSTITPELYGGFQSTAPVPTNKQYATCGAQVLQKGIITPGTTSFTYESIGTGTGTGGIGAGTGTGEFHLTVAAPSYDIVKTPGFTIGADGRLRYGAKDTLTINEINAVQFNVGGFLVHNVIGSAQAQSGSCAYTTTIETPQFKEYQEWALELQLRYPGPNGCTDAIQPITAPLGFLSSYQAKIRVQKAAAAPAAAIAQIEKMKTLYTAKDWIGLLNLCLNIIGKQNTDQESAHAFFYCAAAYVNKGVKEDGKPLKHKSDLTGLAETFNARGWDPAVQQSLDFQKIKYYLEKIKEKAEKS